MNNYLIESDNSYSINKIIEEIINKNKFNDGTISTYQLDESTLDKALEDLDTYSLLSSKKVIIIKEIDLLKKDEQEQEKEHLLKYLENPNPDNLLIIIGNKLDNKLKFIKELKKYTKYIEPIYNSNDLVKELLKEYKITSSNIEYIIELCDNDQIKLEQECNKLKLYKIDSKEIEKEDIDEIVIKKFGDSTNLVFQFTRDLAENNKKEALNIYRELLDYGRHPLEIVSLIANQLRTLLKIKILEENNYSKIDIANSLNKKPFYIEKQKELTRLYSLNDISDLIKKLNELDIKMKTTDLDYNMLIEMYIINI